MKVLSFSSCFPSSQDPQRGIFVLHRVAALAKLAKLEVVHPIGWFPGFQGEFDNPPSSCEQIDGVSVHHRRYLYLPGLFKSLDSVSYARGLRRWLDRYVAQDGPVGLLDAHFAWPDGVAVSRLARRLDLP